MKSVAIVGFYDPTLPAVKNTTADEIWLANHGYMIMKDEIPRCDRLFEIHKENWFRRKELPAHERYWEWLCTPQTFPIYMQYDIPAIPNRIVYPFDEVCEDIFPHLLRQDPSGQLIRDTFLTSSVSFMMALAIHERFDQIWIYGVGMETNTEYAYQLPGFTYMIGLANGRGIDVINQHNSPICKSEVYAYSAIPYVSLDRLRELREMYRVKLEEAAATSRKVIADFNAGKSTDMKAAQEAGDITQAWNGAYIMLDTLVERESEYLSRQALEVERRTYFRFSDDFKAETNAILGKFETLMTQGKREEAGKLWPDYLKARASMHANSGAVQVLDNLVRECDLQIVDHKIILTIEDLEVKE